MKYTIKAVGDPREWSSQKFGGRFYAYPCDLQDENGQVALGVEWSRKVDSDAPKVGDTIHGEIQSGQHGEKLKVDWDAMKGGGGGSYSASTSVRGGGKSDEVQASIARQVALKILAPTINQHGLTDKVKGLVGELEQFIAAAGSDPVTDVAKAFDATPAANGGAGDSQTPAPAAAGMSEPDDVPFARPEYGEVFGERERRSNRP